MSVFIFINANAGAGKATNVLKIVKAIVEKNAIPFVVFRDEWPNNIGAASEAWIIGGDGTLNFFLNKYPEVSIPLAIFKGGTGNDFSNTLYGKMSAAEQAQHVMNAPARKVDAATCNGKIFINSMGIGFDGEVVRSMTKDNSGYLWAIIKNICSYRSGIHEIVCNALNIKKKFLLLLVANGSRAGGGFLISPESRLDDGKLNIVLSAPLNLIQRLLNLGSIKAGTHISKKFIKHFESDKLTIKCHKKTAAHLDGEFFESDSFDIEVLPGRYLFRY